MIHRLCSDDANFLEKDTEMISFSEQRGYSPTPLQCHLDAIQWISCTEVLNNHSPSNNGLNRNPLVLDTSQPCYRVETSRTYHLIFSADANLQAPRSSIDINKAFTCQKSGSSGLVYCIPCRRCPAIYIDEMEHTLRQNFSDHLWSRRKSCWFSHCQAF